MQLTKKQLMERAKEERKKSGTGDKAKSGKKVRTANIQGRCYSKGQVL